MKLQKGDEVKIQIGKDKGKSGKITRVFTKENKVIVEGLNQYKRHVKAKMQGQKSEIVTITKPFAAARVALMCPHCKKQTRIGYLIEKNEKLRICKKCNKKI